MDGSANGRPYTTAPLFAPSSSNVQTHVDLDEIFDDCFAASEWNMINESLNGAPPPPPTSGVPPGHRLQRVERVETRAAGRVETRKTETEDFGDEDSDDSDDDGAKGGDARKRRRHATESKSLTDQQRVERRERNREHAKRSRIRKKFLLESLLEQVSDLRGENKDLRQAIREHLPDEAHTLLSECSTEESQLLCVDQQNPMATTQQLMEPDFRLMMALQLAQQNFAVSDPSLPDNPIVYASKGFLQLTGYTMSQVIGRNCRFLQGPGTDPKAVDIIREGVTAGVDTSICLLNYKADGTPFWNQFFVASLRDADGSIVNYVGVQCEVNQVPIEEIKERAKRMALLDI